MANDDVEEGHHEKRDFLASPTLHAGRRFHHGQALIHGGLQPVGEQGSQLFAARQKLILNQARGAWPEGEPLHDGAHRGFRVHRLCGFCFVALYGAGEQGEYRGDSSLEDRGIECRLVGEVVVEAGNANSDLVGHIAKGRPRVALAAEIFFGGVEYTLGGVGTSPASSRLGGVLGRDGGFCHVFFLTN